MALTPDDLRGMDSKPVIIVTHTDTPVSIGVLRLSESSPADATPRLDLHFETETMRCVMRVPVPRVDELAASWTGEMYRYVLPPGNQVWLPRGEPAASPLPPGEPTIETYPVPLPPTRPLTSRRDA